MQTDARSCPICDADLTAAGTPVRVEVHRSTARGRPTRSAREPICHACNTASAHVRRPDGRADAWTLAATEEGVCAACGLTVLVAPNPRRRVMTCSDHCRSRYYADRAASATPAVTHPCAECGREVPGRADLRYCSPACRQRAYRQRQRVPRQP